MNINKIRLEKNEKILMQVRRHWFIVATQFLGILIVAILPYLAYVALTSNEVVAELFVKHVSAGMVVSFYSAWLLVMWMALFNIWNNYYLDVWTITNKRLIAVDQQGFFFRTTASFRLERMQDIEISVNGLLATFLDYGTLEIQTAAEQRNFRATGLPSPGDLKAVILRATNTDERATRQFDDGL